MGKYNYEFVKEYIERNSECKLLSTEYINTKSKLKLKCKCGNEFERNFEVFKRNKFNVCPKCGHARGNINSVHTYEHVKEFIENNGCELISTEYKNAHSKLKIRCKCGECFETNFNHFQNQNKRQCKKCGNKLRNKNRILTINEIKSFVEENSESKLISEIYNDIREELTFKCSCGRIFKTSFDGFKWRMVRRCRTCASSISNMEYDISIELDKRKINYIQQYKFDNCKDKIKLPFDFYLPDKNMCIEADGRQHFEVVCFGNTSVEEANKNFKIVKKHDKIKDDYCRDNNIKLIRIPYFKKKEIKNILESILN